MESGRRVSESAATATESGSVMCIESPLTVRGVGCHGGRVGRLCRDVGLGHRHLRGRFACGLASGGESGLAHASEYVLSGQFGHFGGIFKDFGRRHGAQRLIPAEFWQVIAVALGQIERSDLAGGLGPHDETAQSVVLKVSVHVGALGVGKLVVGRVVFHRKHYGLHVALRHRAGLWSNRPSTRSCRRPRAGYSSPRRCVAT